MNKIEITMTEILLGTPDSPCHIARFHVLFPPQEFPGRGTGWDLRIHVPRSLTDTRIIEQEAIKRLRCDLQGLTAAIAGQP